MKSSIKKQRAKFEYDYENDILYVHPLKRGYDSSYQMDNFIFDLDNKGKISGLEIISASKVFNIPKINLKNHNSATMELTVGDSFIRMSISLTSIIRNATRVGSLNVERIRPSFIEPSEMSLAIA